MIDFSHANSQKDYRRQREVAEAVALQVGGGERRIMGVMVESHLKEGRQDLVAGRTLLYGQSITDACLGWDDSVQLLGLLGEAVRRRRLASGRSR
jgi:3-deoxy-7-phosphoheptulonate synthase